MKPLFVGEGCVREADKEGMKEEGRGGEGGYTSFPWNFRPSHSSESPSFCIGG